MAQPIRHHRDLLVWQRAMQLADLMYDLTQRLPVSERYGLCSQIRRAAVSVPANIAEGHGRDHLGDYLRFLSFAMGSLMELDTLIRIAVMRGFVTLDEVSAAMATADEVGRMLSGLSRSLRQRYRSA
jgi:four helix bundle protein